MIWSCQPTSSSVHVDRISQENINCIKTISVYILSISIFLNACVSTLPSTNDFDRSSYGLGRQTTYTLHCFGLSCNVDLRSRLLVTTSSGSANFHHSNYQKGKKKNLLPHCQTVFPKTYRHNISLWNEPFHHTTNSNSLSR